jgi:hypothetical protein
MLCNLTVLSVKLTIISAIRSLVSQIRLVAVRIRMASHDQLLDKVQLRTCSEITSHFYNPITVTQSVA